MADLSGESGVDRLALRLEDPSPETAERHGRGRARPPGHACPASTASRTCRGCRAPGDWPGKADTEAFARFLSVLTVLALLSAVVLVSSTMSTLVAEQTREIGIMRAIGARRRQVAAVYLRTTLLLGAIAAAVGACPRRPALQPAGAATSAPLFWVVDVGFGVDPPVLAVSLLVGLLAPALAALPADPPRPPGRPAGRPRGQRLRPSAARGRLTGRCGGPGSYRARCRSGCATSGGASDGAWPPP